MPTREVHYFPPPSDGVRHDNTLVLLYMDRPAVAYWRDYVTSSQHDRAELNANPELRAALARVLMNLHLNWAESHLARRSGSTYTLDSADGRRILEAITWLYGEFADELSGSDSVAGHRPGLVGHAAQILFRRDQVLKWQEGAIGDYAIRDWSHQPFGAACHAWAPGAKSWEVRERFARFGFTVPTDRPCLHICGEAYSDYQGFIEGALRTAKDVVKAIKEADDVRPR